MSSSVPSVGGSPGRRVILVPGAWMGAWIWEPTVQALTQRGLAARTLTLPGLEPGAEEVDVAAVSLTDHVHYLADLVAREGEDGNQVVLVSHSYSSMVTGQVADRLPEVVHRLVHFGGFLPTDGRTFLADWGDSDEEREAEERDVTENGYLWAAPERQMLEMVGDLSEEDRTFLAERFGAHPGRTILEPAVLDRPVTEQPTTYVALSTEGAEVAWRDAPALARDADGWTRRHLETGHWPMLTAFDEVVDLIASEAVGP